METGYLDFISGNAYDAIFCIQCSGEIAEDVCTEDKKNYIVCKLIGNYSTNRTKWGAIEGRQRKVMQIHEIPV